MTTDTITIDPPPVVIPEDDLDVDRFWQDNDIAVRDPFGSDIPQVPMGIGMGIFAAFAELGLVQDMRRVEDDEAFALAVARAYNERARQIVGRPLISEEGIRLLRHRPKVKLVGELFECRNIWNSESWWLTESAHNPQELSALLDRVEKLDVRTAMLGEDWDDQVRHWRNHTDLPLGLGKHLRGPVTLAMSIYGVENLIYLILDEPQLAARFRDVILKVMLEYYTIADEVSDPEAVRPGFSFADDNCALLTDEMYAFFGQPILKAVFERYAPLPEHRRYQHSDSDMGHLLPLLAETGLTGVNFGPTLTVKQIRDAMPRAVIEGQLAPFTFMRNDEAGIKAEVRRDLEQGMPQRGLIISTAGSVNDGTLLTSLRLVMRTIQRYGRYD